MPRSALSLTKGLIAVAGLPRSGTTLISRMLTDHSLVDALMEPYQAGRMKLYKQTSFMKLCRDKNIEPKQDRFVLIKETTTRTENVSLLFRLLKDARSLGDYTGLIIVLRSPFEAFLSQVHASSNIWLEKKMTNPSDKHFQTFAKLAVAGLAEIVWHARSQHCRVINYDDFCSDPENELSRLLGLFPLRLEQQQLELSKTAHRGGDPKAYSGASIEKTDRSAETEELLGNLPDTPLKRKMLELQKISEDAASMSTTQTIDQLAELVIMKQ